MKNVLNITLNNRELNKYNTSKYRYKAIKNAIEDAFIDFDFILDSEIRLRIKKVSESRFIVDVSLIQYFINFSIALNNLNESILKLDDNMITKEKLHNLINEKEHKHIINIIKDDTLDIESFKNNKSFYVSISDMCIY